VSTEANPAALPAIAPGTLVLLRVPQPDGTFREAWVAIDVLTAHIKGAVMDELDAAIDDLTGETGAQSA
jgi:hypothetical protein